MRIVACDTSIPGRDDGTLDVEWLAERLADDRETPTIVAMHHPPLLTGLPGSTRSACPPISAPRWPSCWRDAPNVKRVVAGHVHRVIADTLGGCGVITCASTNIQSGPGLHRRPTWCWSNEPPSLLVHALLDSGELVTHVQPI